MNTKILVCDDEQGILDITQMILKASRDFRLLQHLPLVLKRFVRPADKILEPSVTTKLVNLACTTFIKNQ